MKKSIFGRAVVFLLSLALTVGLFGCNNAASETETISTTRIFTDSCGREVELPEKITRVAVSGPLTEIVFFGFAPELMVCWSSSLSETAAVYIPSEYMELPDLGQLYGGKGSLNLEELLAVDPDVVVDIGEPKGTVVEDMDALQQQTGIPFVHIDAVTTQMDETFIMLGELTGLTERSLEYSEYCKTVLARTQSIIDKVGDKKVRALYCLGDTGCNVIARGSYHAEVIDMMIDNLAVVDNPSAKGSGNEVDLEQILNWNPDYIIFAPDSIADTVGTDPTWKTVRPIAEGNYVKVPSGPYNWMGFPPSVQRYLGMIWLTKSLYPEYTDYDLQTEITEYYRMFYHIELTDEMYSELIS